ncbi:hypothetical protein [Stenotrophomonas rhizophila]|uniref:hypothetical protein n=1 Tax=Stenotrophomonas rhizophila TaxID=216778 RepID=UPI00163AF075|nr:hypothetical protein [Stenotrophomonas rhizophila]
MRKMQCIGVVLIMMISCGASGAGAWSVYSIDGVRKGDGMVAIIDAESGSLIMSSDSFVLGDCGKLSPSVGCINSKYFTLHLDPLVALEVDRQWAYESFRFSVVRECVFMSPTGNANGFEVASEHFHGRFEF